LSAELRHDMALPLALDSSSTVDVAAITDAQRELETDVIQALAIDNVPPKQRVVEHSLDIRYAGQEYALTVPVAAGQSAGDIVRSFHALHEQSYGHSAPGEPVEVVAARIVGIGAIGAEEPPTKPLQSALTVRQRNVWFQEDGGYVMSRIYQRSQLTVGIRVSGPAIVEQLDSTTVIPRGYRAHVDDFGNLIIRAGDQHD
jgi:N-methylhydantoinase A